MSQYSPGESSRFETGRTGGETHGEDLASETKEAVHKVTERVKEGASEAVDEVRSQAKSVIHDQQEHVADGLESVCEALHDTADKLREQDIPGFAGVIDQAADRMDSFAKYIREKDIQDMFDAAQDWTRRNPALFLGGCFVGGLLIARVLKSSASGAMEQQSSSGRRFGDEPAYRPRDVGQSRFGSQSVGQQYGGSAFSSPSSGVSEPGQGTGGSWEEP